MKIVLSTTALLLAASSSVSTATAAAFVGGGTARFHQQTFLRGYLDDLSEELYSADPNPDVEAESHAATNAKADQVTNYGVSDWKDFVDFDEFDGGDGQMGVAGDGKKGLDKEWSGQAQMAKSKTMSAKNAWGKSTGYANVLIDKGVDVQRAQQLENWHNQQEVLNQRKAARWMTDDFDQTASTEDEDWRKLGKFGVERNQEFDLDAEFGAVVPGTNIEGTIELVSRLNRIEAYEFKHRNSFMGFNDFRARFSDDTSSEWTVEPTEGSLNGRQDTDFVVKYRPSNPGSSEGFLVIDTEDDKWTWKLSGTASM